MSYTRINPKTETSTSVSGVRLTRHGGICTLYLAEREVATGWVTIGTAPSGWRPNQVINGPIIATGGNGLCGILKLGTDGKLEAYNGTGSARAFAGGFSYKLA